MEHLSGVDGPDDEIAWYTSYGRVWVVGTIVFFTTLRILLSRIGVPASVDVKEAWRWRNTVISWVHAVIVGCWTLYCIAAYPGMRANPLDYINPCLFSMVVFSTTYFVYDFADHVLAQMVIADWEVSLHHVAVAATFVYNISILKCLGYTSYALLTEVSSTFLHQRRLLKLVKADHDGRAYRLNALANIICCFFFRGAPCILVPSGFFIHPVIERLGMTYFVISLLSSVTLSVIQVFLFFRLYKTDFLTPSRPPRRPATDMDNNDIKLNGKEHQN